MARLQTAEFDYELTEELIAQRPAARREDARLLVVHRATRTLEHRRFFELPGFLRAGDQLIRNTARVRPARLFARRPGGGSVECLLLRPKKMADSNYASPDTRESPAGIGGASGDAPSGRAAPTQTPTSPLRTSSTVERWWCLLRPGRRLPIGAMFGVDGEFTARVADKSSTAEYLVEFTPARAGETVAAMAERLGRVPLPPYIHRPGPGADDPAAPEDRARYQTVFADHTHTVAVAAPTAGLHFSESLLAQLSARDVEFVDVVLHVGLGTFRPIETADVAAHPIHREVIEVSAATQARLASTIAGRRIAVGTTAVRAVEHFARVATTGGGSTKSDFIGEADLFIHPPATFRVVDGLITNFHLPRSTLLCLVAAFLTPGSTDGAAWLREIYAVAMRERYRFLSYGDAMLIL